MPKKTGFIQTNKPINKVTGFEKKWGEPAWKIAERENVKTVSIYMRVHNYGTPYQRSAKPSRYEELYGKTSNEIALELNLHPFTVQCRLRNHGDCYYESSYTNSRSQFPHNWKTDPKWNKNRRWLMPEHHDYDKWFSTPEVTL